MFTNMLTIVYASTNYVRRQDLWEDLKRIADDMEDPWMVLGDFNALLAISERRGELKTLPPVVCKALRIWFKIAI